MGEILALLSKAAIKLFKLLQMLLQVSEMYDIITLMLKYIIFM